jgi:hypothetical protein
VTVLVMVGAAMSFQPPLAPRASASDAGVTSVVDVPTATQVVDVQPTDVSGTEMLVDGTPDTSGSGATGAVPHEAKSNAAMDPRAQTSVHERALADTRLMAFLSFVRQLSLR